MDSLLHANTKSQGDALISDFNAAVLAPLLNGGEVDALGRRREAARLDILKYPPQTSNYLYSMLRYHSRDVCLHLPPKCKVTIRSSLSFEEEMNYAAQRHREFMLGETVH